MLLIDTPAPPANTMDKGKLIRYGDELYRAFVDREPVDPLTNHIFVPETGRGIVVYAET